MLSLPDKLPHLVIPSVALSSLHSHQRLEGSSRTQTPTHSIMLYSFLAPEQPSVSVQEMVATVTLWQMQW